MYSRLIFILGAVVFALSLENSLIFPVLKSVIVETGDPLTAGWLVTSYLLVASISAPLCGRFGDIYSRSRTLCILLALPGSGSLLSALAHDVRWILAGRAIQGLSGAGIPLCFGLLRERLAGERVPMGIGILYAVTGFGTGLALVVGGSLTDHVGWRSIFWASSAGSLGSLVLMSLWLSPSPKRSGRAPQADIAGALLFAIGLTAIMVAIGMIARKGLTGGGAGLCIGGLLVLALWARHEWRHPCPLINVRQFTKREIALANVCMAFTALGMVQLTQLMLLLLQQPVWTGVGLGVSATLASVFKLPANGSAILGSLWGGRVCGRFGARRGLIIGAAVGTIAWSLLAVYHGSIWSIIWLGVLSNFGFAMIIVSAPVVIMAAVAPDRTSEATGLNSVVRTIFYAAGALVMTAVLDTSTISTTARGAARFPTEKAYIATFIMIAIFSGLGLLAACALPSRAGALQPVPK